MDDLVDTRWTLSIASWLLRSNGSGPVFPLHWPIWDGEPIRVIEEKSIVDEITGFATTHSSSLI